MSDLFGQLTSGWGEAFRDVGTLIREGVSGVGASIQETGVELMDWATGRGSTAEVNRALQATAARCGITPEQR